MQNGYVPGGPGAAGQSRPGWRTPLLITALVVVVLTAFIACISAVVLLGMRNSDAATMAFDIAQRDPAIIDHLGTPLERGWLVMGNIHVSTTSGSAELAIPISGPKGRGTLYVEARKRAGRWNIQLLQFAPQDGQERFDLLSPVPIPRNVT